MKEKQNNFTVKFPKGHKTPGKIREYRKNAGVMMWKIIEEAVELFLKKHKENNK